MSGGIDSSGKGSGSTKAKKGGFLDGLKSFGATIVDGFLNGSVSVGTGGRRSVDRRDPVAAHERPVAAKQIQRSMKAWRDKEADPPEVDEKADEPATVGDATGSSEAAGSEGAGKEAAGSEDAGTEPAGEGAGGEAAAEGAGTEPAAEGAGGDKPAEATTGPVEEAKPEVATKSLSVAAKLKGIHRKVFRSPEGGEEEESVEDDSVEGEIEGEGEIARKIHRTARDPATGRFTAGGLAKHPDPSVVIEGGKYMLPVGLRSQVRAKCYGTGYRKDVDEWRDKVVKKASTHPTNPNLWKYNGTWYDKTTMEGQPTVGHTAMAVAAHWVSKGNNCEHATRKEFWNGDGNPAGNLTVQPRTVNCADNGGSFDPEVKLGYRGP